MRVKLVLIATLAWGCGSVTTSAKKDAESPAAAPAPAPATTIEAVCRPSATCKEHADAHVCSWKTTCDATGSLPLPSNLGAPKGDLKLALGAAGVAVGAIGIAYDEATNGVKLPEGKTIAKDTAVTLAVFSKKPTTYGDFQCVGESESSSSGSSEVTKEFRPMSCFTVKPCDGAKLDVSALEGLTGIRIGGTLIAQPSVVALTATRCTLLTTFPFVAVEAYTQPAELIPESECATMRAELEDKIKTYVEFTKIKDCTVDADCVFTHYPEAVPSLSDCGNYQVYAKAARTQYESFLADTTVETIRRRLSQGLCLADTQKANLVCSIEEQKPACIDKACKPKP